MRVVLCRSKLIGSYAIRWITFGQWSHAAIIDGDHVIEATWPRVRAVPLAKFFAKHPDREIINFDVRDEKAAIWTARAQIGQPYDLGAVLGWLFHRDWQANDKWDCAEMVAYCLQQGGLRLFRPNSLSRVAPQHLWMVSK